MKSNEKESISRVEKESLDRVLATLKDFNKEIPLHWHTFYELELVLDGVGTHVLNGEERTVRRGSAYLLTPTDFHTVRAIKPMKLWHISFDEQILSERRIYELHSGHVQKNFELDEVNLSKLSNLAQILSDECNMKNGCERELCESILCILLRHGTASQTSERAHPSGIRRAIMYMNMHFRENPSLSAIARQAGFHPNYFSELFKEITGENYTSRLTELKLGYAKRLLAAGFSVSDACYQSGFGSISNFLSSFKRVVGMTPLEYKKIAT